MTVQEHEVGAVSIEETIDWGSLTPFCEGVNRYMTCGNLGEIVTIFKHLEGMCPKEGTFRLICGSCYEQYRTKAHICFECRRPASRFSI